jgi:hypothetical protein
MNNSLKHMLFFIYCLYLGLLPALSNLFIIPRIEDDFLRAMYVFVGLMVGVMFIAVRIETLKPPKTWGDMLALLSTALIPLVFAIRNNTSFLDYMGIVVIIELLSLLIGLIALGLIGGGIGYMDTLQKDLIDIVKSPAEILRNIKRVGLPLALIFVLLVFISLSFLDFLEQFSSLELIIIFAIPIVTNMVEYIRNLYNPFRSKFDYGIIAIIGGFAWFFTYGIASWNL